MRTFALFLSILLSLPAVAGAQRSLHWTGLDVTASLDADGRLLVRERHTMVFDGDWNGGERTFLVGFGQDLTIHGIYRADPRTGEWVRLQLGGLDQVDHWDWATGETLRWRSRLPSDPPFAKQTLVYLLDYSLTGVVVKRGDGYRLDHDFVPRSRPGDVERFSLELEVDPAWRAVSELPHSIERLSLAPGEGAVVTAELEYVGEGSPALVTAAVRLEVRVAIFAFALVAVGILFLRFRRHESEQGRYDEPDVPDPIDRAFLDEHLLSRRAEVVGGFWDRKVGPPEVAATLARLVAEGKLESEVWEKGKWIKKRVLYLELLVDRDEFEGYERELIDKLFFDDRVRTDTEVLRTYYSDQGFSPVSILRDPVEELIGSEFESPPGLARAWPVWLAFVAMLICIGLEKTTRGDSALVVLAPILLIVVPAMVVGMGFAVSYRQRSRRLELASLGFLVPLALMTAVILVLAFAEDFLGASIPDFFPGIFGVLALALTPVAVASLFFHLARTRDSPEGVRERRRLAEIRHYFVEELRRPQPQLEDAWFPYLLAFGLDRQVDRWFASFGGARVSDRYHSTSTSGSSGSSGWTGGGGTFGGAGASGGWAAAAAGIAAGVAAPSSSSSGGGGGGSFSGGGGAGGW